MQEKRYFMFLVVCTVHNYKFMIISSYDIAGTSRKVVTDWDADIVLCKLCVICGITVSGNVLWRKICWVYYGFLLAWHQTVAANMVTVKYVYIYYMIYTYMIWIWIWSIQFIYSKCYGFGITICDTSGAFLQTWLNLNPMMGIWLHP